VQAVVVALVVAQQQWRRPQLPGGVAAREERRVIDGELGRALRGLVARQLGCPAVGDRCEPRVPGRAQLGDRRRQRITRSTGTRRGRKPCAAITTRLRKPSPSYSAASARHSAGASMSLDHRGATRVENRRASRAEIESRRPGRRATTARASCGHWLRPRARLRATGFAPGFAPGFAIEQLALALDAPSGSPTGHRRCGPRGGTGSRRRAHWLRTPGPPPAPRAARRSGERCRGSSPSCRPGSGAAPSTPAAGTRCRGCRAAARCRAAAARPGRRRARPAARTRHLAPTSRALGNFALEVVGQRLRLVAEQDRAHARARSPRPGSHRASTGRSRTGSRRRGPPARYAVGVMPSTPFAAS